MNAVEDRIIDIVKKISKNEKISLETKLGREEGIDSLGIVQLIIEVEESFNINCDEYLIDIRNASNIKALCNIVCKMIEEDKGPNG